jgi:GTP cyclohydrolase III
MNYKEILERLKSTEDIRDFAFIREFHDLPEIGNVDVIDSYGGEGQGENWYKVYFFKDHNVYAKLEGYYTSYDGVSFYNGWDCLFEVMPSEKTIVVYDTVKN